MIRKQNHSSSRQSGARPGKPVRKGDLIRLLTGAGLLLLTGLFMLLFKRFPALFFPGYRRFSRFFMNLLSCITGVFPFAVWDIAEVLLILLFLFTLIRMIIKKRPFLKWFSTVFLIASILLSEVVDCWMLNHYAPPLSDELGLQKDKYSEEELFDATVHYLRKAASYAPLMERDEKGSLVRQDFSELASLAGKSYLPLAKIWPVFKGSSQRVKYLSLFGTYFLYRGTTGEFMPLTGESTVPKMDAVADLPFTMCHEVSHRLGIASEEEANFCAFLACEASDDVRFLYSGYYMAYVYCWNALKSSSRKTLRDTYSDEFALVFFDASEVSAYYDQFDSPLEEVETKINDSYLKTFSEESGVKSYGEVVDDLLAWYLSGR